MLRRVQRAWDVSLTGRVFLLIAACCLLASCGNRMVVYTVTGKVTFAGKPVEVGTIRFESPTTGFATQSALEKAGAYAVKVPPGTYTVVIEPQLIENRDKGPVDYAYKGGENIPPKYRQSNTTDLRAEITADATVDFDMPKAANR